MPDPGYMRRSPVTYTGMLWLLAAQLVVMLPLAFYLPVWLIPVLLFSAGWRLRVMQGHMEQPGTIGILIIGSLGIIALTVSGIPRVSLDMMASLLMLGFAYKSLEVIQRRDAMVVILTGYLLVGVLFLYSQSILAALYGVFSMTVLTASMIALQSSKSTVMLVNLRLAGLMLLLCLPLMITFFVFTPRFSPLWTFTLPSSQAKTGMTDRLTPGDIARLSQSDEPAFRVNFAGERPAQKALYWRGLVLNHFDGKTWTQFADDIDPESVKTVLKTNEYNIKNRLVKKGSGLRYSVIYEKTAQPWLFALSPVVDIQGDAAFGRDFRIMARKNVMEPLQLTLLSYPLALRDVILPPWRQQLALQLPSQGNPRSRQLAQKLLAKSPTKSHFIQTVMNRYRTQDFYYTLRPPVLQTTDTIDEFLFSSRRGFCAHYAGSFVFLMRAAGIPARIVAGYQGGEWNEKGNYLTVHQYDAHAWTEVWLENQGWVRFDPTLMVAPQRIEQNLQTAVSEEGSFLEGQLLTFAKYNWLNSIRKRLDSGQYAWRKFVLGYNGETQSQLMQRLFGKLSLLKTALIIASLFFVISLLWLVSLGLARRHPQEAPEHQLYRRFCTLLEKQGIHRAPSQTPHNFAQLAASRLPALASEIQTFTNNYIQLCYSPPEDSDSHATLQRLKTRFNSLSKAIKTLRKTTGT